MKTVEQKKKMYERESYFVMSDLHVKLEKNILYFNSKRKGEMNWCGFFVLSQKLYRLWGFTNQPIIGLIRLDFLDECIYRNMCFFLLVSNMWLVLMFWWTLVNWSLSNWSQLLSLMFLICPHNPFFFSFYF